MKGIAGGIGRLRGRKKNGPEKKRKREVICKSVEGRKEIERSK